MHGKAVSKAPYDKEQPRRDIERFNAMLRHFRGVAASVLNDAQKTWEEIFEDCRDQRTCEEIIEGINEACGQLPACGWPEFREKLQGVLEIAGATCHEVNQPLQYIYLLLNEVSTEYPDNKNLQEILRQCDRIKSITQKMETITIYESTDYIRGQRIVDINEASRKK